MDSSVTNTKAISIHAAARSEPREDEIMRIVNKLWNAIVALTNYGAKVQVNLTVGPPPATSRQLAFCDNRRDSLYFCIASSGGFSVRRKPKFLNAGLDFNWRLFRRVLTAGNRNRYLFPCLMLEESIFKKKSLNKMARKQLHY